MTSSTHIRSADRITKSDLLTPNFVQRKHKPVAKINNLFMAASVAALAISAVFYYNVMTGFYICGASAVIVFFIARQLLSLQHLISSTEFLNALLSSIVNNTYKFTIIARNDGEIVYLNHAFQTMFPAFVKDEPLNIPTLCKSQRIAESDQKILMDKITLCSAAEIKIPMLAADTTSPQVMTLSLQPIRNFGQYVLIHGL